MTLNKIRKILALALIVGSAHGFSPAIALATTASAIDRDARSVLDKLYKRIPGAKALADKAVAVLVFPSIVKGGFIIAGQYGDGALTKKGKSVAYIDRFPPLMDTRRAFSRSAMCCSSWTMPRLSILTTATVGSWGRTEFGSAR